MNHRQQQLLQGLDLPHQMGVEIGPMDRPIVSRGDGKIIYVDRWSPDDIENKEIEKNEYNLKQVFVDAVWRDKSLRKSIGKGVVNYVIASHVVEHTCDLIDWLSQIHEVLQESKGTLRLAVPDKRYTFDVLRELSRPSDIFAAHMAKNKFPGVSCLLDFYLNYCDWGGHEAWDHQFFPPVTPKYSPKEALVKTQKALANIQDEDVHCWVFTPYNFAQILLELCESEVVCSQCSYHHPTQQFSNEFILGLDAASSKEKAIASWKAMIAEEEPAHFLFQARQSQAFMAHRNAQRKNLETSVMQGATELGFM